MHALTAGHASPREVTRVAPSPPIASTADALHVDRASTWSCPPATAGPARGSPADLLPERARTDAFRHGQSRGEFVVGRALVRRLVAAATTGLPARGDPDRAGLPPGCRSDRHGKPRVSVVGGSPVLDHPTAADGCSLASSRDEGLRSASTSRRSAIDQPARPGPERFVGHGVRGAGLVALRRGRGHAPALVHDPMVPEGGCRQAGRRRPGSKMRDVRGQRRTVVPLDAPELPIAVVGAVAKAPTARPTLSWWSVPAD